MMDCEEGGREAVPSSSFSILECVCSFTKDRPISTFLCTAASTVTLPSVKGLLSHNVCCPAVEIKAAF